MANLNITNIPAPRVPFIDERTGLMAREWYRFFLNLFVLTGSGNNPVTLEELQLGPPNQPDLAELLIQINQNIAPQYEDQSGDFLATLDTAQLMSMISRFENAEAAIQGAYLQPVVQTGTIANYNLDGSPTAGGIAYGTGPALAVSAAGTVGQVLTSAGAGTPTWATPTTGTVTSVAALTLGTSGTDLSSTVANGTTTPVITLQVPTASASNRGALSAADWTTFNNKGSGTVTSVTGTAPVASSGGATPAISMAASTTSVNGYLTSTDWTTFNSKQAALVSGTNLKTVNGTTLLGSGDLGTITYAFGGTGLTSYTAGDIIYASASNTVAKLAIGTSGQRLVVAAGLPSWATDTTVGTVTSVAQSFTGGLISVAGSPITTSGTLALTVAGTSGGIPYFSSASTWATSAALAASALVLGGGAGAAPATTTTGTGVVTALGVNTGAAGAFVVNGGALGTPSSGTVTNLTGTASININGTVGATTPTTGSFTTMKASTGAAVGGATPQSGGIAFPATAVAVADANTLDDYEEGTWTAAFVPSTSGTITLTGATGTYVKIGRAVTIAGVFTVASVSSPVGYLTITGLPFAGGTGNSFRTAVSIVGDGLAATMTTFLTATIQSDFNIYVIKSNGSGGISGGAQDIQAGSEIFIGGTYQIS